jgi:hypothetical protein
MISVIVSGAMQSSAEEVGGCFESIDIESKVFRADVSAYDPMTETACSSSARFTSGARTRFFRLNLPVDQRFQCRTYFLVETQSDGCFPD